MAPTTSDWRAKYPSADDRADLRSLKAQICRRCVLGTLYFTWVCGLTGGASMVGYSLFAFARTAWSLNAIPLPSSVVYSCIFMVLYETYHYLTPGQHRWNAARHFLIDMFATYPYFRRTVCVFDKPVTDTSTTQPPPPQLQPDDKSLFAFHPHGILACGFGMNGVHNPTFVAANTRWLVADNLFWFPFMRDLLHWMDASSVRRETFTTLMARGQNIGFLPGGFEDATLYRHNHHRVFLKHRYGFIKLALQFGYRIYPIYTFGEEQTFYALPFGLDLRLQLNRLQIPAALFVGSKWCFFMPRSRVDLVTVVGVPLQLPQITDPTPADVELYHAQYIKLLQQLFDKHKVTYARDANATLEIF